MDSCFRRNDNVEIGFEFYYPAAPSGPEALWAGGCCGAVY